MGWVVNATPRRIYPRERPGTHSRLGGLQGWSERVRKISTPTGIRSDPRAVQPVASRYADWAIGAHPRRIEHWNLLLVFSDWIPFFWQQRRAGSVVWDLWAPLIKLIDERQLSSGWEGRGWGDLLSAALLEMLDFWLTRLSHVRSLLFCRSPCHLLILNLRAILLYKAPLFGFQTIFTKTPMSSFHGLFAVLYSTAHNANHEPNLHSSCNHVYKARVAKCWSSSLL
jgi:hypothetical protein